MKKQLTAAQQSALERFARATTTTDLDLTAKACRGIFRTRRGLHAYATEKNKRAATRKAEPTERDTTWETHWAKAREPRAPFNLGWDDVPYDGRTRQYLAHPGVVLPAQDDVDLSRGTSDRMEVGMKMRRKNPGGKTLRAAAKRDLLRERDTRHSLLTIVTSSAAPAWMREDAQRRLHAVPTAQ